VNALISNMTAVQFNINVILNSFDRLLVHGVCQFLDLKSTSEYILLENSYDFLSIPFHLKQGIGFEYAIHIGSNTI